MVKNRDEIAAEYRWDLEKMFSSRDEWEQEFQDVQQELEKFERFRGKVTESPETLREVLELREDVSRRTSNVAAYARMRRDQDTRNQDAQAIASRAKSLRSKVSAETSFVKSEIQQEDSERLEELVESEELQEFRHNLENLLRLKPYALSKELENTLADLGEVLGTASDVYGMFTDADLTFPKLDRDGEQVELTQSNFTKFLKDPDREFRREVYEKFYDRFSEFRNTVATTLDKNVRTDTKLARIRGYDSSLEAALTPSNIPVKLYDNLIDAVNDDIPTLRRHAELKEKTLGVDQLKMWDVYMPTAREEQPGIEYEEAKNTVLEALAPLGDEYVSRAREGLDSRWVDVYENRGKRSGAYSGGSYDSPPYILMNYQDDVTSMYTLAHELGHSMHSFYTTENQPYRYSDYDIFIAEIASTVNEQLLTQHLLEHGDEKLKAFALDHQLENFRNTLFRQTMFAEFEKVVHAKVEDGQPLTPDVLDSEYRELKQKYYGEDVMDDRIAREWMRIPHFYYNFYVFQYATGISAASRIKELILDGKSEEYLDFLKRGGSDYPLELLGTLGIDMASGEPVRAAINEYDKYLDRAESIE
ncbi:MAG: oligoendopeptidase F [Candidatus Nanohaloarchaea archaeon]